MAFQVWLRRWGCGRAADAGGRVARDRLLVWRGPTMFHASRDGFAPAKAALSMRRLPWDGRVEARSEAHSKRSPRWRIESPRRRGRVVLL
jgi:hypothetical protein